MAKKHAEMNPSERRQSQGLGEDYPYDTKLSKKNISKRSKNCRSSC